MKIVLFIFVVLTAAFSQEDAEDASLKQKWAEYDACTEKCSKEDKNFKWVCYGDGIEGYTSRCDFNCHNKAMEDGKLKEVKCKVGGFPYCHDFECRPEEKIEKEGEYYCSKDLDRPRMKVYFATICNIKCYSGNYNKDSVYEPCKMDA